jgi:hypothetical protein
LLVLPVLMANCHDVARLGIKLANLVGFFSSISDSKSLPNGSRLGVTLRVTLRNVTVTCFLYAFCEASGEHQG